jgi:hypothetical protein
MSVASPPVVPGFGIGQILEGRHVTLPKKFAIAAVTPAKESQRPGEMNWRCTLQMKSEKGKSETAHFAGSIRRRFK